MRRVTFTNPRGESFQLSNVGPFYLTRLEGTGGARATIQMLKSPYQDGMTYIGNTLEPRDLSLEGAILPGEDIYTRRSQLARVLNPKLGPGVLRFEYDGKAKEIRAIAEQSPIFPDKQRGVYHRFMINLICPDPSWYDPVKERITLASFVGGFSFPMRLPANFGTVGQFIDVINRGDLDTPVLISFAGPLRNPVLENRTTGQTIRIIQEIPAGERLEISTAFGAKTVVRIQADGTRSNAFHWVSPESQFWQLAPGINEVSYATTEAAGNGAAALEFYHRYVGV